MKAQFNILYNRRKSLDKSGRAPVHIQIYISDKEKPLVSTGVKIEPEFWNEKAQEVDYSHSDAINLNDIIRNKLNALKDYESLLLRKKSFLTAEKVRDFVKSNHKITDSFNSFYQVLMLQNKRNDSDTMRDHNQTLVHLTNFKKNIRFEDINTALIDELTNYLISIGISRNTITKHYKNIKTYLNLAIDSDLFQYDQYRKIKFRIKYKASKKVYLTYMEIDRIEDLTFPDHPSIELSRLTFLFSCYTGLRFSDVQTIDKKQLSKNEKGYILDLKKCYKTEEPVYLPTYELFAGRGEDILNTLLSKTNDDYPLIVPKISNPEVNLGLKIIMEQAKINKHLTFHISRHTFGTLLAYESGSAFTVMQYMGIAKIDTARQYIHLSNELGDEYLKGIKWKVKRRPNGQS